MTTVRRGGLLTEGARTNLLLRSEEFNDAYWTNTRLTVTANAAIAPNGVLTGDKLVEDSTANNTHSIFRQLGVTAAAHTLSVFAKAAERNWLSLNLILSGGGLRNAYFDLANGTLGTIDADYTTARIEPFGNGWYRCSVTRTTTAATWIGGFFLANANNGASYTGDGTSGLFLFGAQLELGPNASTYTPTVAATVTRPTDQASYANFPQPAEIAARGGITVYHRFVEQGTRDTATGRYYQVGDGAAASTNRLLRAVGDSALLSAQLGNGTAFVTSGTLSPGAIGALVEIVVRVRYTSSGNTFAVQIERSINGAPPSINAFSTELDATALLASGWQGAATLHVGARDGGNNPGFALNQALKARFGIHDLAAMRALV